MQPSLEELYRTFLATGDEAALEQLLRRSAPTLRRLAQRLGAGPEDADDLVQETIVAAIQGADRYDATRPLLPWLKGILTFRAAKLARDESRRRRHYAETEHLEVDSARSDTTEVAEAASGRELHADVHAAIAKLPAAYREPLRLFLIGGRSPIEIAHGLGLQRGTVRARLHRGLRRLRERLVRWVAPLLAFAFVRPAAALARAVDAPRRVLALALLALVGVAFATWSAFGESTRATGSQPGPLADTADSSWSPEPRAAELAPTASRREAAAVPASERADLVVSVRDHGDRPVPGVAVTLVPASGRDPVLHRRTAVTDRDGQVRWTGLACMAIRLTTDRGSALRRTLRGGSNTIEVQNPSAALAQGRVVDARGEPVAGASIWLGSDPDAPWRGADVTRSAVDGSFAVPDVQEGAVFAARHPVLAGTCVARFTPDQDLTLRLRDAGGRVAVLVRDGDGRPLPDALVFVGEAMDAEPLWLADGAAPWRAPPFEARTLADGRVRTDALATGLHPIHVRAHGHVPLRTEVAVVANREVACEVTLTRGDAVHGRVTDATGSAIPGAQVVWRSADPGAWVDLTTGPDGRFVFEGLGPAGGEVAARAHGHRAVVTEIPTGAGRARPVAIVLPHARRIAGALKREDGGSVEGARMLAVWPESALRDARAGSEVAADGSFTWMADTDLAPEVRVLLPGEPLWRSRELVTTWDQDRVVVVVPHASTARSHFFGKLRTSEGRGLARARLFVCRDAVQWQEVGATDAEGAFRIGPLPRGSYDLFAESTHPELPSLLVGRYSLGEAEKVEVLQSAPPHGVLDLEILRSDGGDVGDAVITLVGVELERRFALATRPHLRQALVPGEYRIHVMGSRVQWLDGRVVRIAAAEETRVEIALPAARRCHLTLLGLPAPQGDPERAAAERQVRLLAAGSEAVLGTFTLIPDAPSRVVAVLAPGSYRLEAPQPDGSVLGGAFGVPEGDTPPAPITVLLTSRAGAEQRDARPAHARARAPGR